MSPKRVQLRRTKGWRLPEGAVNVARPTRWGNPYVVGEGGLAYQGPAWGSAGRYSPEPSSADLPLDRGLTAEEAVALYRDCLVSNFTAPPYQEHPVDRAIREEVIAAVGLLRGRDLACWCGPSDACHADVLLDVANR